MVPTQISCRVFPTQGFFLAGFFWPPSDSSIFVNCRSALYHVMYCLLVCVNTVLGLIRQNKPNGFVHVVYCVVELKCKLVIHFCIPNLLNDQFLDSSALAWLMRPGR